MGQSELFRTAAYSNIVLLVSFGTGTTLLRLQSGQKKEESAVIPGLTLQGGAGLLSSLFSLIPATHTPPEAIILNCTISKSP